MTQKPSDKTPTPTPAAPDQKSDVRQSLAESLALRLRSARENGPDAELREVVAVMLDLIDALEEHLDNKYQRRPS